MWSETKGRSIILGRHRSEDKQAGRQTHRDSPRKDRSGTEQVDNGEASRNKYGKVEQEASDNLAEKVSPGRGSIPG